MVPKTVYTYDVVFSSSVFFMLWTIKVWSTSLYRWTDHEDRIYKPVEYKFFPHRYRHEMENRRAYVVIFLFLFIIFFLLKIPYILRNHFVTQNIMIDRFYPPTYLPKTSDRHFAWQNGCGHRPLIKDCCKNHLYHKPLLKCYDEFFQF